MSDEINVLFLARGDKRIEGVCGLNLDAAWVPEKGPVPLSALVSLREMVVIKTSYRLRGFERSVSQETEVEDLCETPR